MLLGLGRYTQYRTEVLRTCSSITETGSQKKKLKQKSMVDSFLAEKNPARNLAKCGKVWERVKQESVILTTNNGIVRKTRHYNSVR
ncbi:hypothetical protein SAMN05421863_108811 [Nitrosomonas communis]|uniref:Uncharacterized protein n=1 Tax=Nitrosomonas communis TaxID=44574 RepID=A0A1I4VQZ4_9PROT|nr:hypothetical protein SAMN05421863_108811 [Nitrosomonas communis]